MMTVTDISRLSTTFGKDGHHLEVLSCVYSFLAHQAGSAPRSFPS